MFKKFILLLLLTLSLLSAGYKKIPHFAAMGNSGVAYGLHPAAAFINPALPALDLNTAAFFIAYDRRLDEVNELMFSSYLPVYQDLKFGITYQSNTVQGIPLVDFGDLMSGYGPDEAAIDHTSYTDDVIGLLLAYKLPNFWFMSNMALGFNYKQYNFRYSDLSGNNSRGEDFDLGFYADLNRELSVGLSMRDFTAGQLNWDTGLQEDIDAVYTLGIAFRYWEGMKLLLDYDLYQNSTYPGLLHAGMDIAANQYLSYRFGIDSVHYSEDGEEQKVKMLLNIGLGMSLLDRALILDYSYLQSDGFIQDGSHLLSMSWLIDDPWNSINSLMGGRATADEQTAEVLPSYDFKIVEPADNFYTYQKELSLKIINAAYKQVTINERSYQLKNGLNQIELPLTVSLNSFKIKVADRQQKRDVYRLPAAAHQRYAVDQLVLAGNWKDQQYKAALSLKEFALYLINTMDSDISADLLNVFSPTDILITSGIFPDDAYRVQQVSRGLFADVLIRMTGNDHIYSDQSISKQDAAFKFLTESDLVYPEVITPAQEAISEKEAIFWLAAIYQKRELPRSFCFNYNLINGEQLYLVLPNKDLVTQLNCDSKPVAKINIINKFNLDQCSEISIEDVYGNHYSVYSSQKKSADIISGKAATKVVAKQAGIKVTKQPPVTKATRDRSVINIELAPQIVEPGAVLKINWSSEIDFERIYIKTESGNFNMQKIDSNQFVLSHQLPSDIQGLYYDLEFIAETKNGDFIKQYRRVAARGSIPAQGVKAAATSILSDQTSVYLKAKPELVAHGDQLTIYAGLSGSQPGKKYLVKTVFSNQKELTMTRMGENIYKGTLQIDKSFNSGENQYKLFVKDLDSNQFYYQSGSFQVKNSVGTSAKAASSSKDNYFAANTRFVKLRGDQYKIVVEPVNKLINQVTVITADNHKTALWQEKQFFVGTIKAQQGAEIKLYLKDVDGKYDMKKLKVK